MTATMNMFEYYMTLFVNELVDKHGYDREVLVNTWRDMNTKFMDFEATKVVEEAPKKTKGKKAKATETETEAAEEAPKKTKGKKAKAAETETEAVEVDSGAEEAPKKTKGKKAKAAETETVEVENKCVHVTPKGKKCAHEALEGTDKCKTHTPKSKNNSKATTPVAAEDTPVAAEETTPVAAEETMWKQIKIGGELTKYEISKDDGSVRFIHDFKGKQACDYLQLVSTKMVHAKQGRQREVVTLFHDNRAWCIDLEALYVHTFDTVEDVEDEKPTVEDVEKLFGTPSPSPKPQETCPFEFKGGKKNGTTCGKPLAENSDYCAVHGKKKTSDKKNTVAVLSDTEEANANQVVANKKLPCEFVLTAGKNKGKACGKIECKAHAGKIVPKPTQEN